MTTVQERYRNSLDFREENILDVLPDFFAEDYPLLIKLFEYYFEFVRENSPSNRIKNLFDSRDITAVSEDLLQYLQRELLLGVDNFGGFANQRDALKVNSELYNAKGSKYSLQQFFRFFYGFDPEIIYTKNNVFIVNDSKIGYESRKFITNDRLYQTFAVLIKAPISLSQWEDAYKMFVHPAGMYLGAEVQIADVATIGFEAPEALEDVEIGTIVVSDVATVTVTGTEEVTAVVDD